MVEWLNHFRKKGKKPTKGRAGAMATHWIRIREVPNSNHGTDLIVTFFVVSPQSSRQMLGCIFITTIHLTIIRQIHKLKKNR